jgi:hypothetical protein
MDFIGWLMVKDARRTERKLQSGIALLQVRPFLCMVDQEISKEVR